MSKHPVTIGAKTAHTRCQAVWYPRQPQSFGGQPKRWEERTQDDGPPDELVVTDGLDITIRLTRLTHIRLGVE